MMMSNNLWVGNIGRDVTDSDLYDLFFHYGALDGVTSYSTRSYAFVLFKRKEEAAAAKDALQSTPVRGLPIKIEFARPALMVKYSRAMSNVMELEKRGCVVLHGVDVHKMSQHPFLSYIRFDRIVYNFPHAGYLHGQSSSEHNQYQIW